MSKISNYFVENETIVSPDGDKAGLKNTPNPMQKENIRYAAARMDLVRYIVGRCKTNSWFRSKEINTLVNGSKTSDHMNGLAIDFKPLDISVKDAFNKIKNSGISYDQLILYSTFIHISFNNDIMKERKQILYK